MERQTSVDNERSGGRRVTRSEPDVALSRSNPTERSRIFVFPQRGTRLSPFLSPSPHPYGSRLSWKQVGARFLLSVVLFSQESDQCADAFDPDSKLLIQTGLSCPPPSSTSSRPNSSSTQSSQTRTPVSISSSTSKPVSCRARPSMAFRFNILQTFRGDHRVDFWIQPGSTRQRYTVHSQRRTRYTPPCPGIGGNLRIFPVVHDRQERTRSHSRGCLHNYLERVRPPSM